jgi:phosphoribosylformylglycinamidine synthase subunit PurSL
MEHPAPAAIYRFTVRPLGEPDPRSAAYLADAHALGMLEVRHIQCQDLYFIQGQIAPLDLRRIAAELLSDPITQAAEWGRVFSDENSQQPNKTGIVEVAWIPGVTDPVAENLVHAARTLGLSGVDQAATGLRFVVQGEGLDEPALARLARRLLANPTIQRFALGEIAPVFPQAARASGLVECLPVTDLDDAGLLQLSAERRAALDLAEMQAVRAYYQAAGREPTDVELETIAQTWSEHCVHKTFKARIEALPAGAPDDHPPLVIDGLLNTYLRAATEAVGAPWVRSAFVDNAGIVDFDGEFEVSFKVETHNHPSAIEPFGGANTGVGGVIRDVLGVSARPIAATDVLCFGPQDLPLEDLPEGVLHPRRIQSGVTAGVQDYGNKLGVPTVSGAILYDPGYTANPLVFCGCVGLAPLGSHPRQPQPGDRVVVLGGRTGRDGLRGATFSSMTMDGQTGEVAGASVQIGDPITEKGLVEVILRARDRRLYHAVTDCGAGGLSSAVGEMSSTCGAEVELQQVRLKYPGLAPWEIWLSEAQERMVLAVPPRALPDLQDLCGTFDVELTDLGQFTDTGRLVVRYAGQTVLDLDNHFLHDGLPQRRLQAKIPIPTSTPLHLPDMDCKQALLALLAHPDIASKERIIRRYDHEVQGATVIKPLTGAANDGPSNACVLKPLAARGREGIVISNGINPHYGLLDPYRMAWLAVDEAVRNATAVGADPQRISLLDNFCWGDPTRPETLGSLVEAARGCHDAALHYGAPFISGKDSLNNEYLGADGQRRAIPPTLLISALGLIPDVSQAVTLDLKAPGNWLYLVGEHHPSLGGSRLVQIYPQSQGDLPPIPNEALQVYQALHRAIEAGLVLSSHDLSEGGLGVAAAEMAIAGRLGLTLELDHPQPALVLFGESGGCLLLEVDPAHTLDLEACFHGLPCQRVGEVQAGPAFRVQVSGRIVLETDLKALCQAWQGQN